MVDEFKKMMHKRDNYLYFNKYKGKDKRKLNKLARTELKRKDRNNQLNQKE